MASSQLRFPSRGQLLCAGGPPST
ncbi:uncharacterized protein G2W53_015526 [Senna tora]|uniref:Uncharacterized protein n=1 Tax=Senna tora TaxID=362788 RepID=A0A834WVM5_9FABA|nr:uncharacterized protein G2W53_015526 [Senna tora]